MFVLFCFVVLTNNVGEGNNNTVAVLTGISSGIGREISLMLARNGFATNTTMRNLTKGSELKGIADKERLPLKIAQL